jgi:hypothetical protein
MDGRQKRRIEDGEIPVPSEAVSKRAFEEPSISPGTDLVDPQSALPMMALIGPASGEI